MAKYQPYPEYKSSGVEWLGDVPRGWSPLKGKYIFDNIVKLSISGNEELLSVSEYYGVKPRSLTIAEGEHLTRAENLIGYKKCQKNDLVMNIMLAWKRGLGVSDYNGIVSPAYSVFRFSNTIFPQYMHYLLRTNLYTSNFKSRSTGVIDSRLRLYPETFGNVEILTPDLFEQQKIAAFLDYETAQMDELVAKQEKLLELLKEKRQAVISHAVTKGLNPNAEMKDSGIEWLGQIPKHCELSKVRFISSFGRGLGITKANLKDEGVHCVSYGEIHSKFGFEVNPEVHELKCVDESYLKSSKESLLSNGDFVFADTSEDIEGAGNFTHHSGSAKLFAGYHTVLVRPDESNLPRFLAYIFDSYEFRSQVQLAVKGVKVFSVTQAILKACVVWLPSKSEQHKIVEYLDNQTAKIDKTIEKAEQAIELLKERRTALISAAVTGKIDVRSWEHPAGQKTKKVNVA